MAKKYDFNSVIPWHILKNWLEAQAKATGSNLRRATKDNFEAIQGRAQILDELLNLPRILDNVYNDEDDKEEKKA